MHKKFINHLWGIAFGLGLLLPFPMGIAIAQSNPTDAAPKPTTHSVNTGETPANTPFNTSHPETSGQPKAEASAILAPKHHLERGTALLRLGNPKGAAASFLRVIQTQPNNLTAHQQLRRALIETHDSGKLQESLPALIKTLNSHGHRNLALQRLGELRILEPSPEVLATLEQELQLNSALSQPNPPTTIWDRLRSLFGMAVLLGIAFIFSANRKKIDYRLVGWGMGLQFFFALIILWTPPGRWLFDAARLIIHRVLSFTDEGASFLFGNIYNGIVSNGASGPVQVMDGTTGDYMNLGLVFAFHILPTVIFFGSLMSVLYHLGVVQRIVKGFAWIMMRTMGTSGSESLSAASNIFVGQTEAPLVVRPFLDTMTVSELMAIMVGGFATVAGGVLAAYTRFGIDPGHLLAASVMSAPAALVVAKVMYPETQASTTSGESVTIPSTETSNIIDAAAIGATDGLKLALNVAAMLVAFIALIAMLNWLIGGLGTLVGLDGLSLKQIFGVIFYPISWCMGVHEADLIQFGNLLGTKISINEFVAFVDLGALQGKMTERSTTIATYALCGFANFSSIGIQIGGISSVAPNRRKDLAMIGLKAMVGGAIASWLTACVAGILL